MRFGLALPHYDYSLPSPTEPIAADPVVHIARRAEALGFDSLWISDHFFLSIEKYGGGEREHGSLEPFLTLAAVIAATEKIRVGTLVASAPFRHPSMVAQQAATLDQASGGRFELGLGAGWYEDEFTPFGMRFESLGDRFETLERTTELMVALRTGEAVESVGAVALAGARVLAPARDPWPIWIGAKGGPRAMRLIARSADGWNTAWRWTPKTYAEKAALLDQACETEGRDPATVRRSIGLYSLIGEDEADLASRWSALQAWTPNGALDQTSLEQYATDTLTGTPDQLHETIAAYDELGVEEIIINPASMPFGLFQDEQLDLAAASLIR